MATPQQPPSGWTPPPPNYWAPPPGWALVPVSAPPQAVDAYVLPPPAPSPVMALPPGAPPVPGTPAPLGLATWDARAYASLIDLAIGVSLIQGYQLALSMVGWLAQLLIWLAGGSYATVIQGGYWGLILAWWGWQWALRGRTGQSVGQRLIGVRVVDIQTRMPIGPGRSLIRSVTHVLDVLPLGLGLVRPVWDRQQQTWADRIHQTVVIATSPR